MWWDKTAAACSSSRSPCRRACSSFEAVCRVVRCSLWSTVCGFVVSYLARAAAEVVVAAPSNGRGKYRKPTAAPQAQANVGQRQPAIRHQFTGELRTKPEKLHDQQWAGIAAHSGTRKGTS